LIKATLLLNQSCTGRYAEHKAYFPVTPASLYQQSYHTRPRFSCTTHLMLFSERLPIYASCMTISDGRTKQQVIIAGFGELAAID